MKEKLEDFYHITITEDQIRDAIRLKNHERRAMLGFLELGKLNLDKRENHWLSQR